MTERKRIPKSRRRLPGEPPFSAPADPSAICIRDHFAGQRNTAQTRMNRIRREARALMAPLQRAAVNQEPPHRPISPAPESRLPGRVNIISDVLLKPARTGYHSRTHWSNNLARLGWAAAHAEELFPEPPHRVYRELPALIPIPVAPPSCVRPVYRRRVPFGGTGTYGTRECVGRSRGY